MVTVPTSSVALLAGGIIVGLVSGIFEMADGIQALDVLIGLQLLVLTAVWRMGREVATFKSGLSAKPTLEDVRREIREYALGARHGKASSE